MTDTENRLNALREGRTDFGCVRFVPAEVGEMFDARTIHASYDGEGEPFEVMGQFTVMVAKPGVTIHRHDELCHAPVALELAIAGLTMPEGGWWNRSP